MLRLYGRFRPHLLKSSSSHSFVRWSCQKERTPGPEEALWTQRKKFTFTFTPHFYLPWLIIHMYPKWTFFVHSNYLHVVIALPRSLEERERAIQIEQVEEHESHFRASPPILQNARWIILTISSSQLVCNSGDPPMTCTQGDKTLKKQKQDKSHWHLGNRRGIRSLSFVV